MSNWPWFILNQLWKTRRTVPVNTSEDVQSTVRLARETRARPRKWVNPPRFIYIIFFASILHDWHCRNRCPLQQRIFRYSTSVFSSKRLCYNKSLYKVVGTISEGCLHTNCHTFLYQKINAYQESFSLFGYVCFLGQFLRSVLTQLSKLLHLL